MLTKDHEHPYEINGIGNSVQQDKNRFQISQSPLCTLIQGTRLWGRWLDSAWLFCNHRWGFPRHPTRKSGYAKFTLSSIILYWITNDLTYANGAGHNMSADRTLAEREHCCCICWWTEGGHYDLNCDRSTTRTSSLNIDTGFTLSATWL